LLHDHASAEESDTGNDIGDDLRAADIAIEVDADVHEGRGAHRDQDMRP
jgi:hypothetical protein